MKSTPSHLPDDPEKLKKFIAEYEAEVRLLREQVKYLYAKLFGRKSEKYGKDSPQLLLFDLPEPEDIEAEGDDEEILVPSHTKRKGRRAPLPDCLPRVENIHDIDEEDKICACGANLVRIGEETSEKLDIIPAVIQVVRHIRPKYCCKSCEGVETKGSTVKIAPVPPQIIPKSIASGGLLAHIFTAKFEDALPFYRQEKQFKRLGTEINRSNMSSWAMKVAEKIQPLLDLLHSQVLTGPLINIDETTIQVLKEPGRSPAQKSYMWLFRGGDPEKPTCIFQYHSTRSGDVASSFLKNYAGAVQSDGFSGYDFLDSNTSILHIGCWAHARRKFMDADKARGKNKGKVGSTTIALNYIRKLYGIEKKAKNLILSPAEYLAMRKTQSQPILDDFKKWLEKKSLQVVPKSLLGMAISYTLNQWHRLAAFIDCGSATPDNNLAENCIRPFVVGRKNWLFAGSPKGAEASAAIYSLIESAKACKLDVYAYLRFVFEHIPFASVIADYEKLLPYNLNANLLKLPAGFSAV